jgi:hypothetical protein
MEITKRLETYCSSMCKACYTTPMCTPSNPPDTLLKEEISKGMAGGSYSVLRLARAT